MKSALALACLCLSLASLAPATAHAADQTGAVDLSIGYVSSPESTKGLQDDLSTANKKQKVVCLNVVTVRTGGTMGSATGGLCMIGEAEPVWACRNDMLGTTATDYVAAGGISNGLQLTSLIARSCIGG